MFRKNDGTPALPANARLCALFGFALGSVVCSGMEPRPKVLRIAPGEEYEWFEGLAAISLMLQSSDQTEVLRGLEKSGLAGAQLRDTEVVEAITALCQNGAALETRYMATEALAEINATRSRAKFKAWAETAPHPSMRLAAARGLLREMSLLRSEADAFMMAVINGLRVDETEPERERRAIISEERRALRKELGQARERDISFSQLLSERVKSRVSYGYDMRSMLPSYAIGLVYQFADSYRLPQPKVQKDESPQKRAELVQAWWNDCRAEALAQLPVGPRLMRVGRPIPTTAMDWDEGVTLILNLLHSPEKKDKLDACRMIRHLDSPGDLLGTAIETELRVIVGDSLTDLEIRQQAVEAIWALGNSDVRAFLRVFLDKRYPLPLRVRVAQRLFSAPRSEELEAIMEVLLDALDADSGRDADLMTERVQLQTLAAMADLGRRHGSAALPNEIQTIGHAERLRQVRAWWQANKVAMLDHARRVSTTTSAE